MTFAFSRLHGNDSNRGTGQGFVHSLNQIRVERSKDLLRDHSISLAAITEMIGFEDQSYFTKVFRRHAGMSPGHFRKNWGAASGG